MFGAVPSASLSFFLGGVTLETNPLKKNILGIEGFGATGLRQVHYTIRMGDLKAFQPKHAAPLSELLALLVEACLPLSVFLKAGFRGCI